MKRNIKHFTVILAALITIPTASVSYSDFQQPISLSSTSTSDVELYANDIQWVYQTINGKLYKRLYNYTTNTWIGDWILVG